MTKEWEYRSGNNWVICDVCGFKYRADQIRLRWDNKYVCYDDWEMRQPQDFVRARIDKVVADIRRPPPTDVFVDACTLWGRMGVCDVGTADCAICDLDTGARPVCTVEGGWAISGIGVSGCSLAGNFN